MFDPTDLALLIRLHREEYGDPDKKSKRKDYVVTTINNVLRGVEREDEDENVGGRVLIKVRPGNLATVTSKAAIALGQLTKKNPFEGVYWYGDQLVKVARRASGSGMRQPGLSGRQRIVRADQELIEQEFEKICHFVRYSKSRSQWVRADVPTKAARWLLARGATWPTIPILIGIGETPTLRPDGMVLSEPGYDPNTGLRTTPAGSSSRGCQSRRRVGTRWPLSRRSPRCSAALPSSTQRA